MTIVTTHFLAGFTAHLKQDEKEEQHDNDDVFDDAFFPTLGMLILCICIIASSYDDICYFAFFSITSSCSDNYDDAFHLISNKPLRDKFA